MKKPRGVKRLSHTLLHRTPSIGAAGLERLLHGETDGERALALREKSPGALEAQAHIQRLNAEFNLQHKATPKKASAQMTVSLYASTATGKREIVVQTNAQSLDLFISGLADAIDTAMHCVNSDERAELLASTLRNAFPVAFSIAGYKADRVSETRMLVCGATSPGESSLLAHSRT